MMKQLICIVFGLIATSGAYAGHHTPRPEAPDGSLLLEAENGPSGKASPDHQTLTTLYPSAVQVDLPRMEVSADARIVVHDGYKDSRIILDYQLPHDTFGGQFQIQAAFTLGGVSPQKFTLYAGPNADRLQARATFTLSNQKSWEMAWQSARANLTIFPGDRIIRIDTTGKASGRKILDAILLTKYEELPADMTPATGQLRVQLQRNPDSPTSRFYVLEADQAAPADLIYQAIEKSGQAETAAIQTVFGAQSKQLATIMGVQKRPAILVTNKDLTVQGILEAPADIAMIHTFIANPTIPAGERPSPLSRKIERMNKGVASAWSIVGTWSGPAGLTLWGLDWEERIRPSSQDPEVMTAFDTVMATRWREEKSAADGSVLIEEQTRDLTWSRGAAYACLYIRGNRKETVSLHVAHTGNDMKVWLDDQAVKTNPDQEKRMEFVRENIQPTERSVTDQGNPIEVSRIQAQVPQKATLTLTPGWHRLLIKLITQQGKNQKFNFSAVFTDASGKPADFEVSTSAPDTDLMAYSTMRDLQAIIGSNRPFNLITTGDEVTLKINLDRPGIHNPKWPPGRSLGSLYASQPPIPILPAPVKLRVVVKSYDQQIIHDSTATSTFPGNIDVNIGRYQETGYYSIELTAMSPEGKILRQFPPDGFSVIGGTSAQFERRAKKKMATTFYFMIKGYKEIYFPYMQRIGIYRNVGGNNGRALELYSTAHSLGLELAVDFWNRKADYNREFIIETAPYVNVYKSFNEIDIHPEWRGTSEFWVEKSRREYEMVKELDPTAIVLGGSWVRVGNDPWFHRCLELGLEDTLDVWDVHCYPQIAPVLEGRMANSSVESELGVINALAKLGRTTNKPFWMGETGARASHGYDARRWQADMVTKMTAWALSRDNMHIIGYLIPWEYSRQNNGSMNDIEAGHMPAEAAYYISSALIDGFDYKRVETPPTIQAGQFGPTLLAWSTSAKETLQIPAKIGVEYALVDSVGRLKSLKADSSGTIKLELTTSPHYLLPMQDYRRLTAN